MHSAQPFASQGDVWRNVALDSSTRHGAESLDSGTQVSCKHNILDYFYIFFRARSASSFAQFNDQEHILRRRFNQWNFTGSGEIAAVQCLVYSF